MNQIYIVSKFPNHLKEEDEGPHADEVELDPKNTMSSNLSSEDQEADTMKKDKDTNASELVCKEDNIDGGLQKE